jgi:hypothetical protein
LIGMRKVGCAVLIGALRAPLDVTAQQFGRAL